MELTKEKKQSSISFIMPRKTQISWALVSILQDFDMTGEFVIDQKQSKTSGIPSRFQQIASIDEQKSQSDTNSEDIKSNISRLQIQIKKLQVDLIPLTGQLFLMIFQAYLFSKSSKEKGKLMMTNYRIIFFKDSVKRVDLPFGLISTITYKDNQNQITYQLKFPHSWSFQIVTSKPKFAMFKNFGILYYKPVQFKNMFANQYRIKSADINNDYSFEIQSQYKRLQISNYPEQFTYLKNYNFAYNRTYTNVVVIPKTKVDIKAISNHRKNARFPILAYLFRTLHNNTPPSLWITSEYEDIKSINKQNEIDFLQSMARNQGIQVYVTSTKNPKIIDESFFSKNFNVNYLGLYSNDQLRKSEIKMFQVFLYKKVPVINQILSCGWYNYVAKTLESCSTIRNSLLSNKSVIIRCSNGWDKTLLLSSLVQIILEPFYRTFQGFQALVMKMFIHFGHPFALRLGERQQCRQICPIFLHFLDCITQLINQNESSFEYNFKYLSLLGNLMYNNIYGTFLANSPQQYIQNRMEQETVSIWPFLKNPLTQNCNYIKSSGVLNVSSDINSCRFWKEYFSSMISRKRNNYSYEDQAEQNQDYVNLDCLRIKKQNEELKAKLKLKQQIIDEFKSTLKASLLKQQ